MSSRVFKAILLDLKYLIMEQLEINLKPLYEYYKANKEQILMASIITEISVMDILLTNYEICN
jgi:hypothetical protein